MKIIQPSLCRVPPPNGDWFNDYYDPWHLAHNEAWVYQQLAQRQGLAIPYFFGLHSIITPSNEPAWVLVLEFIPGMTVNHQAAMSKVIPTIHDFCTLGVAAVRDFALGAWCLRDIRGPNFILTPASGPGARCVVLIDLFEAREASELTPENVEELARISARDFYVEFLHAVWDVYPGFSKWAHRNLPRDVWGQVTLDDSDEEEEEEEEGEQSAV
ncbi:hypothetical protein B0H17DRAFT_354651 [Mycena rosella]|uniref:Uncharacterized protein n=1 Tax=Mycena rosella TaxID=1033263 RepID=A0AAD7G524_MYCRO|nr:hypothetical protein B0H17DRAFT_354651 [Mycena rosella]